MINVNIAQRDISRVDLLNKQHTRWSIDSTVRAHVRCSVCTLCSAMLEIKRPLLSGKVGSGVHFHKYK